MKTCSKCKIQKSLDNFHKDKSKKDGRRCWCVQCWAEKEKEYRLNNKEAIAKKEKEYRLNNKEAIAKKKKEYQRERCRKDKVFKLKRNVSSAISTSLKSSGGIKNGRTWDKLPYSVMQLKKHLESQFDENMNWNNHGTYWHIDHIIPQSEFWIPDLDHPNFQKCWALKNLRPLPAEENMKKGNKILSEFQKLYEELREWG